MQNGYVERNVHNYKESSKFWEKQIFCAKKNFW